MENVERPAGGNSHTDKNRLLAAAMESIGEELESIVQLCFRPIITRSGSGMPKAVRLHFLQFIDVGFCV